MKEVDQLKIIFFDGVCVLCNKAVNTVLKNNSKRNLKIASLQGIKAQKYLNNEDLKNLNSIIYFTETRKLYKSDAVLEISKDLNFPLSLFQHLEVVPRWFRDLVYDFIASNRYKWYGKNESCRLPTVEEKDRFLD
ncbi:MAG: putative DCC family thiol-disulfide oxidoreductase YuxK [Bacteriovoracaceae bacterium]|jgi:predicted DCC family thiol-disulfide oxidoreductase YuxK